MWIKGCNSHFHIRPDGPWLPAQDINDSVSHILLTPLILAKFRYWQEYQKKITSFFALLWRQHFPCAGLARFFLSFCETEEQAYSHRPLQFGVAGGYPCPWCPTLAIWYDEISWLVQDQSTLEP